MSNVMHDCHATKNKNENGVLAFVFRDGIWVNRQQGIGSLLLEKVLNEFYIENSKGCRDGSFEGEKWKS